MKQNINNTPANSGSGDKFKIAFDKVNANFTELYGLIVTNNKQIENGRNFITAANLPKEQPLEFITGLNLVITTITTNISTINNNLKDLELEITTLNSTVASLNSTVLAQASLIASQSNLIAIINSEIASLKTKVK